MDYSVSDITVCVYDNDKEIIARKYPVIPMLVPQKTDDKTPEPEIVEEKTKKK
jgi:hypothetical protein